MPETYLFSNFFPKKCIMLCKKGMVTEPSLKNNITCAKSFLFL